MADTGENRQIVGRVNPKEAETLRASKKMISEEQSATKARDAAFDGTQKGSRRPKKSNKAQNSDLKTPMM
jgi:hypothetical protein